MRTGVTAQCRCALGRARSDLRCVERALAALALAASLAAACSRSSGSFADAGTASTAAGETGKPAGTGGASASGPASEPYSYSEALAQAIMFYEFQRSGPLPSGQRNNWRGDSGLADGADNGVDLTGGWHDAGDHVKFNLPMAYSVAMLAWSVYEYQAAYEQTGQLAALLDNIKWATDYLMKCHPSADVYYYQVGDPNLDHAWWGPAEVMQMQRPSYVLTPTSSGSAVLGETAAALAATSLAFKSSNPDYAGECLSHAKSLYDFAESTKSDAGYTAASGYYSSSGFYDELSWAAAWLYLATGDQTYLGKAEQYVSQWPTQQQSTTIAYQWGQCWDDVHYGAQLLLARITGKSVYSESVERNLDFWTLGYQGNRIAYTPAGLAWLSSWGPLRYAMATAFLASVWADSKLCSQDRVSVYRAFAKAQADYALGSTGKSFMVGFGSSYPHHPHHRTAHSSWANSMTVPANHRHTLTGALVGGPDQNDVYTDTIDNYTQNEPACDYNAGFVALLAQLTNRLGGSAVPNLAATETPSNDEYYVAAAVNAQGPNFIEIRALLNNQSGWPAHADDQLSFRYFIDISELLASGASAADLTLSTNYNEGATLSGPFAQNGSPTIYYVTLDFTGTLIYPGGQSAFSKEAQFRISAPPNTTYFDPSNDWSFAGVAPQGSTPTENTRIPVYRDGVLLFGQEPPSAPD
ncbi:MAG: glycoside hydrolase family 9 protein [Polyangia bacterium]|jgi:hypothetical protein